MFDSSSMRSGFGVPIVPVPPPPEEPTKAPSGAPEIQVPVIPEKEITAEAIASVIEEPENVTAMAAAFNAATQVEDKPTDAVTVNVESKEPSAEVPEVPAVPDVKVVSNVSQGYVPAGGVVTTRFGESPRRKNSNNVIRRPPQNPGLIKFIDLFKKDGVLSLPDEWVFEAESIRFCKDPGIWEEGGATFGDEGNVLLITDDHGDRKHASVVYHDTHIVNGHHAIIQTKVNDFIVAGYKSEDFSIIAVYQVLSFTSLGAEQYTNKAGKVVTKPEKWDTKVGLVGAFTSTEDGYKWTASSSESFWVEENHPVIVAAKNRSNEMFAHEPIYIKPYNKRPFDKNEWEAMLADTVFMSTTKVFSNIGDMYDAAEVILKEQVPVCKKEQRPMLTLVLDGNAVDNSGKPCLWACAYVTLYNGNTKNSDDNRLFAGCCQLVEGDTFYYPDARENFIPVNDILAAFVNYPINSKTGLKELAGCMLRRMTAD